jgi:hypothetical protein
MFFQTMELELLNTAHFYKIKADFVESDFPNYEVEVSLDSIELLIDRFLDYHSEERRSYPMRFFDIQLQPIFGIDVFGSEFSQSKGYKIYKGERADLLLIRLESLDQCARDAFKAFLDVDDFVLLKANTAKEKEYAPLYQKFRESITFSDAYVDQMYTSKYMRHFYTQDEITRFKSKWCR